MGRHMVGPTSAELQQRVQALYEHVLSVTGEVSRLDARLLDVRLRVLRLVEGPAEPEHVPQSDVVVVN
ncbi:MAG: hypothetical protein JWM90_2313 [Thermoleophilia bacterium]|nr:hypothetical protein [Thermoleophilia bacterium]